MLDDLPALLSYADLSTRLAIPRERVTVLARLGMPRLWPEALEWYEGYLRWQRAPIRTETFTTGGR